ncbi:MAG: tetratricopeptide repeat protein [Candidatus Omnitrophica bacterium]|nr:tetratricopeptide repeat protein [Candidatus Omnitrophota bacterium]MCF7893957.1 tetratricopeptide repeat protein [Candidatus Omnitrophota bacterium]
MKSFVVGLAALSFCFLGFSQTLELKSDQEIFQEISPSIVSIVTKNSGEKKRLGTGFVVASSGVIATNYSSIINAEDVNVEFSGGITYPLTGLIYYSLKKNLVLLKINASGLDAVEFADSFAGQTGDIIYCLESYQDKKYDFSSGIISKVRDFQGLNWFRFKAPVSFETRGSPLINSKGKVLAIVTTLAQGCQPMNLALSAEYIKPQITKDVKVNFEEFKGLMIKADSYFNKAQELYSDRQYKKAIDFLDKFIIIKPDNCGAYNLLGLSYYKMKNYNKAIDNYQKALELDSGFISAYNNLAIVYLEKGKSQEAIKLYEKILEIKPDSLQTLFSLGRIYINLGKYQKAIPYYRNILELDQNNKKAYSYLGWTYGVIGDYQKAITYFKKCSEYSPDDAETYFKIGLIYFEAEDIAKARKNFVKAKDLAQKQGRQRLLNSIKGLLERIGE